jgi:exopolysaccharide biosynthesis protein
MLALALMLASGITFAAPLVKPPTLTITAPKNEAETTNAVYLVTGGVDEGTLAISNVLVSVNAGNWAAATISNATWKIQADLTAGTNTIAAYAADVAGNPSITSTVKLLYAVPVPFTLQIVGEGAVTPALKGHQLDLGVNYTLTARGTNGCDFSYWGGGAPTSTNSKVTFRMTEGLSVTANFRDTTAPTLSIAEPKAGGHYSNATITVTGTAKDNVAVAAVNVQVNGSGWQTASGTNFWSANLPLSPGTNVVEAYAMDEAGNFSRTNEAELLYVVPARFTLEVVGEGAVTPALNGHELNLGVNYTLAAKGTNGCVFSYWGGGVPMTTNSKVTFTMTEGLSVSANFQDTTPPTLAITDPKASENYSNATITVTGTAKDNVAVAEVNVQINGGGWVTATGTTAWSVGLPVLAGANTVEAYAVDAAGNNSKTNEVKFTGYPPQANWAPNAVTNSIIIMVPFYPDTEAPHYACFSATSFTFSDTNSSFQDSCIGNYAYFPWNTNYAVLQAAVTAPPSLNGYDVNFDLAFTNFNLGFYTNEVTGEIGTFSIAPAQQLLPASWAGKTFTLKPGDSTIPESITFTSGSTWEIKWAILKWSGTYVVDNVSPIGALFSLDITSTETPETLYLQMTLTSASAGIYEDSKYEDGSLISTVTGTFK